MARVGDVIPWLLILSACASEVGDQEGSTADAEPLIEFRLVEEESAPGLEPAEYDGDTLYLEPEAVLSDPDFEGIEPLVRPGELLLNICVNPIAGARIESVTRSAIGRRMALVVDSQVRSAPVIMDALGPRIQGGIQVTEEEAQELAERIRARWARCDFSMERVDPPRDADPGDH